MIREILLNQFASAGVVAWSLTGAAMAVAVVVLMLYRRCLTRVYEYAESQTNDRSHTSADHLPSVSVIVYVHDNSHGLEEMLPALLRQPYEGRYEVIVVNDGAEETTHDLLKRLQAEFPRLYHTFAPLDTRNLSRRKLSLTLGIKAAHHDVVLLVTAESRIDSPEWVTRMARHFADPEVDMVIGYAYPDTEADTARGNRRRSANTLIDSVHYLSAAIAGKAYRGTGYNLAYRRKLFFDNKGFAGSINLHYGDDDVFVSQTTDSQNLRVELSPESQVRVVQPDPVVDYRLRRLRYDFTSRYGKRSQLRLYGLCSALQWAWLGLALAAMALSPGNWLVITANVLIGAMLWIPLSIAWRRCARVLNMRRLMWMAPVEMLMRPLGGSIYHAINKRSDTDKYTWQSTR